MKNAIEFGNEFHKQMLGSTDVAKPTDMEATLKKLMDELPEWPVSFIKRVNARVFELKFHKHSAYSLVEHEVECGSVYVVNKCGYVYIASGMIDSRELITFDGHQYPAIKVTESWKN
jgi:hypothetical protein